MKSENKYRDKRVEGSNWRQNLCVNNKVVYTEGSLHGGSGLIYAETLKLNTKSEETISRGSFQSWAHE